MPPVFSSQEEAAIRQQLCDAGRLFFSTLGLKKTSLEQLTQEAGIAKSTFYRFFPSKEALYFELLAAEAPGVRERVFHALDAHTDAFDALRAFLHALIHELETNPLTSRMLTHPEELELIRRRLPPEALAQKAKHAQLPLHEAVARLQGEGKLIPLEPQIVYGQVQAVTLLLLHQNELGPRFRDILAQHIDLIARGLTRPA